MVTPAAQEKIWSPVVTEIGGGTVRLDPRDQTGKTPQQPQFELRCTLFNPDGRYQPGQRAYLRIQIDRKPLAWQWTRSFWQLIQSRQQEKSSLVG